MRSSRLLVLSFLFALSLSIAAIAQDASVTARVVNPVDEKQLVTLKGTMHASANAANDRGAAPDQMRLDRMHLVLQRSPEQETALRKLIADMHTPGTASYHKWLTPDAFGKQFGPSDQDIAAVETWLSGHGFTVSKVNPGKLTLEFSGNVKQFRDTFHAQIHKYDVKGESHYANAGEPQIPAALAPVVGGFTALNNFRAKSYAKYLGTADYDPKRNVAKPSWTVGNPTDGYFFVLSPQDYAVQYDIAPLYSAGVQGAGQTIAIINEANINVGLVNNFRTLFNLPANPPQVIIDGNDPGVDGANNPDGPNGASVEAYLDVEWAGAVAPAATVDLVIGGDTALSSGLFLAAEHAVYGNVAPIMSISFGECEANLGTSTNAFLNTLWEQAAAQGITVMVSTGDNGSAGCDNDNTAEYAVNGQAVNGFASTPYNVAVGGTDFYYSDYSQGLSAVQSQLATYWTETASNNTAVASLKSVIPEQPWNDSQYGLTLTTLQAAGSYNYTSIAAGSGGTSSTYTTKPAWQKSFGDSQRDLPDLSLFASNGVNASYYPICAVDGDCQPVSSGGTVQFSGVGGTSASAPSFAGIMALVNEKYGRQGQADFVLYPLSKQVPAAFHDVANGTNTVPCAEGSANCLTVSNPITITDSNGNIVTEGEVGNITNSTPYYDAVAGYDEASGLGTIDANQLVTNWESVKFAGTTTTFTATTATTFTHGAAFKFDGTVKPASGTATGDVALVTDSSEPNQQGNGYYSLTSGAYSGSTSTLPGGTYNVWAQYGGDATNAASSSTPVSVTVNPENSGIDFIVYGATPGGSTAAETSGFTALYGEQLNLSAQIAPSSQLSAFETCTTNCPVFTIPTGTVTFSDGSSAINTAVLNANGEAAYNAPFTLGPHSVTATYAGDQSYNKSTASPITFTIDQDTPVIVVSSSAYFQDGSFANGPGQPTIVTIQVENSSQNASYRPSPVAPPTGSVTVTSSLSGLSGTQTLGTGVDSSYNAKDGVATFTVPAGTVNGTYNLTVTYSGDPNYNTATSTNSITIETTSGDGYLNSTITGTVSGSVSPSTSITVTGTVTGQPGKAAPTGSVSVYSSGNYPSGANLVTGTGDSSTFSITLNSQNLQQGSNQITLQYLGDNTYNPSAVVIATPIVNTLSDFTLVPAKTLFPVNAGSTYNLQINLASMRGFSGAVSLTCSAATGISCSASPASATLTSGGSATATLQISPSGSTTTGSYNILVTGKDSTGQYVHTLGIQALVTGSTAPTFSLTNSGDVTVTVGATTGNSSTITATPANSFTGTVALSCGITDPPGGTTVIPTCTIPASVDITSATAQTATLAIVTTASTTPGTYVFKVIGTSGSITQMTLVNVTVNAVVPASYALSNGGNVTVIAGATSGNTATITVTPAGGFTGPVALTCAFTTNAATDPATCTLAPASVSITSGAATSTLTVATTASTTGKNDIRTLFWPSAGGATVCALLFFWVPRRRRNWLAMLGLLAIFVGVAGMGCGGGGSSGGGGGGGGNTGTTAGTYTITVTGTSGSASQTTTLTLTVQ